MKLEVSLILVGCAVFLAVDSRRITKDDPPEGKVVIESVPESERPDFLAYTLGHGFMKQYRIESTQIPFPRLLQIPKELENKFKALEKPANFTSDLYVFVKSTYALSGPEMFSLILRRRICLPHPHNKCVDLENIGELCCPF